MEVRLRREPTNPKDSRAVAFDCTFGNSQWYRIGYVVSEAVDAVQHAIEESSIMAVKFEWIPSSLDY